MLIWKEKIIRRIIQKENDIMKKSILFKRTRKSVIRKLSNPYIRENLEYFGYMFSILEICYMLFHLKEINNMFQHQK